MLPDNLSWPESFWQPEMCRQEEMEIKPPTFFGAALPPEPQSSPNGSGLLQERTELSPGLSRLPEM